MQDLMRSSSVPGNIPDSFLTSCSCLADLALVGSCWGSLVSPEGGGGPGGRPGGGPGGGRLNRGGKELADSPRGGGGTDSSKDIEVSPEEKDTVRRSHGAELVTETRGGDWSPLAPAGPQGEQVAGLTAGGRVTAGRQVGREDGPESQHVGVQG